MALLSHDPIYSEDLEKQELIGSGGFGDVYKARHKGLGFDVAVKKPRQAVGPDSSLFMQSEAALNKEADHMSKVSCEFVLRIYGIYLEKSGGGNYMQKGIVMEFMQRGSIQTLQKDLSGPPPWPLAFRLAHQVALGINFLHEKRLIHHDLKPSNVLLDKDLNAKLADFGLARDSTSAMISSEELVKEIGGSYKYMPPEAFHLSYNPCRAFDSYSYGILLWSIFTAKEPYPGKNYTLVEVMITKDEKNVQRPPCDELELIAVNGMTEMVALMKRCWDKEPRKRPQFKECCEITERMYSEHEKGIDDAVREVKTRLDQPESSTKKQNPSTSMGLRNSPQMPVQTVSNDTVDYGRFTEKISVKHLTDEDKANFVDKNWADLVKKVTEVMCIVEELGNMVHSEAYSNIEAEKTTQKKMRALRGTLLSGIKVKAAFYDALKRNHPMLVESLDG
ncbi:receptor-interacting serine/threonine-protein kinase 3-like [Parambassis ranga]|uniref:Receptor-interacting serine/threonine-protein kinase 3-like n=1 Tax=Parambassis ranga TaxID=210632 RepID=A0A6P7KIC0_9TELE|nr:receptor-interacting serine/threonine-protein kinase 3-like [Parambassis ranga]